MPEIPLLYALKPVRYGSSWSPVTIAPLRRPPSRLSTLRCHHAIVSAPVEYPFGCAQPVRVVLLNQLPVAIQLSPLVSLYKYARPLHSPYDILIAHELAVHQLRLVDRFAALLKAHKLTTTMLINNAIRFLFLRKAIHEKRKNKIPFDVYENMRINQIKEHRIVN